MKKSIRNTIISLALCASASCIVSGVSFLSSDSEVAAAATTSAYYTLDGFTIGDSASVRNTSPNGIRFMTVLSDDTKTAIANLNLGNVTYGTLMIPADYLGSKELTHETSAILDIETNNWQDEDKNTVWTSVLAGANGADLNESYYNRPIAARSYVKGTDGEGNTVYYYTENTAVRSIGYVAVMETLDPEGTVTELIQSIADKTKVELVFNEEGQVSTINNGNNDGELVSNALAKSSDSVAVLKIGGIVVPEGFVDINYEVEDTDIIGVNGSTLTANKEGETVVSATCTFNGIEYSIDKSVSTTEYIGDSGYKILISEEAKGASKITTSDFTGVATASRAQYEKLAAETMQSVLWDATGVELPIVTSVSANDKFISIGETSEALADAINSQFTVEGEMSSQVIVDDNKNAYVRGVGNEAVLYGVQEYLGDIVGYEFVMDSTYVVDKDKEIVIVAKEYVPEIMYNVIQGDLRTNDEFNVMDAYNMQAYTRGVIPLGITEEEEDSGYAYKGVAHNSTYLVNQGLTQTNLIYANIKNNTDYAWRHWYATHTETYNIFMTRENYHKLDDPHTEEENSEEIMAELCYTAHGNSESYAALLKVVVDEMIDELADHPDLFRLGFSHTDHRIWCECSACTSAGNAADTLMMFLLDAAAQVEARWSETGRPDSEKELFKISSLFYHRTNTAPINTANYTDKLAYGNHIEIWFAESAADYNTSFDDNASLGSKWNDDVYTNLKNFASLANTYNMDILWWGYYGTTVQFYIPYDSIDAIRGNYKIAKELGVDYMFNQMMSSKQNFTRLKEFLMSELAWNEPADDAEWNSWIKKYFDGSYGAGSEKMQEYYNLWKMNDTYKKAQLTASEYSSTATSVAGSIGKTNVLATSYFSEATLLKWIDIIDQAIAALDPNDPNYETYYWNIKLEKATPLYLMMYIHGKNSSSTSTTTTSFTYPAYVRPYGAEFLEIVNKWDLKYFGEGTIRYIDDFVTAIKSALASVTTTTVDERQVGLASGVVLNDVALTAGTYSVTATNATDVTDKQTGSVTVSEAGTATLGFALTAGKNYIVKFTSDTNVVSFTNVLAVTDYISTVDQLTNISGDAYYVLSTNINCANATFASSNTFTGTLDGNGYTVSNFTVGNGGIFGTLNGATIKNVNFTDVKLNGGALLVTNASGATIENVSAQYTSVSANTTGLMVSASTTDSTLYKDVVMDAAGLDVPNVFGTDATSFKTENVIVNYNKVDSVGVADSKEITTWPLGVNVNFTKEAKLQYVIKGEQDVLLQNAAFVKGQSYTVTVNGVDKTYTVFMEGKLNVKVGDMAEGDKTLVVCRNNATDESYGFDVICVTQVITNLNQLVALGVREDASKVAGNDIDGYYLLGKDLDGAGQLLINAPCCAYSVSNFVGTFDGNGYTISNIIVGDSGIFGGLKNATIKNVNFEGVEIELSANAGWNYGALFARAVTSTTFENITAQYDRIMDIADQDTSIFYTGLFVSEGTYGRVVYKDVTFNVAKAETRVENTIPSIFGAKLDEDALVCDNVTLYMKASQQAAGVVYGYTTSEKTSAVTTKPNGLTIKNAFGITNTVKEVAGGESLQVTTNNESGTLTFNLETPVDGVEISSTGLITVAEGVAPNTKFTVVVSNGEFTDKVTFSVPKFSAALADVVVLYTPDNGTFAVPAGLEGDVEYVKVGNVEIYNKANGLGRLVDGVIEPSGTELNSVTKNTRLTMIVATENYAYSMAAYAFDEATYITTADELKNLGVGGMVNPTIEEHITGYYILADDITIEHDDAGYTDVFAAGYPTYNGSSVNMRFKGVFNGNGHTIDGIRVADGGIFGAMDSAAVINVNFTNVEYLRDEIPSDIIATITNQQGGYMALLAHWAPNSTFQNINVSVASVPSAYSWKRMGMLVVTGSEGGASTFHDITLDATGLTIDNILGISVNSGNVYENVTVIAEGYYAIGYTADSYTSSGANTAAMITEFPAGMIYQYPFQITNEETFVRANSSLEITTNNTDLTYTYELAEEVDGVSVEDNVVIVSKDAVYGNDITVIVTSNQGYVQEITFAIAKAETALAGEVTFETYNNTTVTLPAGLEGTISRITVEGFELYNSAKGFGSIDGTTLTVGGMPSAQNCLGKNKQMVIETSACDYTISANVYTMIINNAAEFDAWQEVAAQNAVDAGLCIEAQKGMTYSGYFVLGNDIEYNKLFTSYKQYGALWGLCYGNSSIWVDGVANGTLVEGAFQEDWGKGLLGGFKGVLDGNGYAVIGMQTSGKYNAMLTTAAGGTIKDIAFTDAKIGSGASLINARGAICLENVYIQVSYMEGGDASSDDSITAVLTARGNQNQWVGASNEIVSSNIIVDVSAIDYASLKGVIIGSLVGAHYENLYVVGAAESVATSGEVGATNAPCLFVELGGNGLDNKDVTARFVDFTSLVKDETYGALVSEWSEPWSVTAADELYFGDYMIYDGMVEIQASAVDANFGHTLAGTSVVIADTATLDLSEIYSNIQGKTVTVEYGNTVIYEGTIDSASWAMPLAQFTAKDGGVKTLIITAGTTKINLPINIVQNVIELNSTNVTSATVLQSILQSNLYGHYVLTSDLDMGGVSLKGIAAFYGILDGQGHVIKNTEIHHDSMVNIDGETVTNNWIQDVSVMNPAFIYVNNGTVKNIGFDLNRFTLASGGGKRGIVCTNYGTVENVYVKTKLIDTHGDRTYDNYLLTGIVARDNAGTVRNVMVDVTVADGVTFVDNTIAAVVFNNTATIENAIAVVTGASNVATVMNNPSATCYNYSVWSDLPTAKVTEMGEPWSVVDNLVYFGSTKVADLTFIQEVEDEYVNDENHQITFENAAFTAGSTWTMNVAGVESEVTVETAGELTVTIDAMAINAKKTSISFTSGGTIIAYNNVRVITYIKTVADLQAIGMGGNNTAATEHRNGYYVLANNITVEHADDYSDVVAAGYHAAGSAHTWFFKGEFDGNGNTIDNLRVSDGGIFGYMEGATVRNLILTNVHLLDTVPSNISSQSGGYAAILAFSAPGSTFEDIEMTIASSPASVWTWKRDGLLVNTSSGGAATYRNITIDASYIGLKTLLGNNHTENNVYENVVIKAASYAAIGYTADSYKDGVQNVDAMLTEFPAGVTFERVIKKTTDVVFNDNSALPVYSGDVTALGFAAGTSVNYTTIADGWNSRAKVVTNNEFDYVDVQFSFDTYAGSMCVWDGINGNYNVTSAGGTAVSGAAERKIQVLDANGNTITSWSANTVYTLRVYLKDVNGGNTVTTLQVSSFDVGVTIYFGNAVHGDVTELNETVNVSVKDGTFTLPENVSGNVSTVIIGNVTVFNSATGLGSIDGNVVTPDATALASLANGEQSIDIKTDAGLYVADALVATDIITTIDELKALGVGGNRTNTENIAGYYVLGNDITIEHADDYSDLVAAGYPANGDYSFTGTFDGNGHTIYNMRVADGGIFGIMRGTVKNLNLANVYLIDSPPSGLSNQNGGYISIIAFVAPGGTIQDVNISIASSPKGWSWKRDGLLVNAGGWGSTTFRNITVDACGIELKTLLGTGHNSSNVYENVVIKAAGYTAIGYTGDSYKDGVQNVDAMITEFPAGVTFELNREIKQDVSVNQVDSTYKYTGDVTELGFEKDTCVFVVEQDTRTSMWSAGTNGYTMERQKVYIYKDAADKYASVLFALDKDATADVFSGNVMFFAWAYDAANNCSTGYFRIDGKSQGCPDGMNVAAYNPDGSVATSFKANTVYELRWYGENLIKFGIGVCNQSTEGSTVTLYYAQSSCGNQAMNEALSGDGLLVGTYNGDETQVGFAEGTLVSAVNIVDGWNSRVIVATDSSYDYVDVQFSLSQSVGALCVWDGIAGNYNVYATGGVSSGAAERTIQIFDANGNTISSFAANTVYTMRIYINDVNGANTITKLQVSTFTTGTTIYFGNVTYGNNA